VTIAYEPVWAIGSDAARVATPEECLEMVIFIRRTLADMFGKKVAESVRVLYGGSVDEKNGITFLQTGGVNGLLAGRVSLSPKKFFCTYSFNYALNFL
jgi:triosephosphate isomerase